MIEAIERADAERAEALARKHTERTRQAYHRSLFQWSAYIRSATEAWRTRANRRTGADARPVQKGPFSAHAN